jgi:antitoxin HicB
MKSIRASTKDDKIHNLEYYLILPYKLVIVHEETGGFFAEIEELPGCMTQGETMDEVLKNIDDAKRLWLKTAYDDKMEIPMPECMQEYSGRFVVRIQPSLHRRIAILADKEGLSLNQMVLSLLTENVTAAEIASAVRSAVWETKKQMDEIYHFDKPLMISEPIKPYIANIPKKTWENSSIKS